MSCAYCNQPNEHTEDDCPVVFTPIKDCEFKDKDDGCCHHPKAFTPECHINACLRLHPNIAAAFNKQFP